MSYRVDRQKSRLKTILSPANADSKKKWWTWRNPRKYTPTNWKARILCRLQPRLKTAV